MASYWCIGYIVLLAAVANPFILESVDAQQQVEPTVSRNSPDRTVLSAVQWQAVDEAVDSAIQWLVVQQARDGSFPTAARGQPAVTSLCLLAMMADGHSPDGGPYGDCIRHGIRYVLSCQRPSGIISAELPRATGDPRGRNREVAKAAVYNHAISALLLGEVYGISSTSITRETQAAIDAAIAWTLAEQRGPTSRPQDRGAWRYLYRKPNNDADLSVTGWQLMFLRSAQNAGFVVPEEPIQTAVEYMKRNFDTRRGVFRYRIDSRKHRITRGMAGVGILALAQAGQHGTAEATSAGSWLLANPFPEFNRVTFEDESYFYAIFNCSQAMYQLGGKYWQQYFPPTALTLVENQNADGSWMAEANSSETRFGRTYTTALCTLALCAPNQILPVFQR